MFPSHDPWKVLSATLGLGVLTDGWNLASDDAEDEQRTFTADILFATPFSSTPVVHIGLTGFDVDQRDSARITLKAVNITTTGFQAVVSSWASTRVFAVEFNWLAIGP